MSVSSASFNDEMAAEMIREEPYDIRLTTMNFRLV